VEFYALRKFLVSGFLCPGFEVAEEWAGAVSLSASGEAALDIVGEFARGSLAEHEVAFQMFRLFYHLDVLIDPEGSDFEVIRHLINQNIVDRVLLLPHRFGRELYDRFNDEFFSNRTDHLMPDDALRLIDGQPQGVYQMGRLLSGPLGILECETPRIVPPTLRVALWHCSDTGCNALHSVRLLNTDRDEVSTHREWRQRLERRLGPPSEWASPLTKASRGDESARTYTDLPTFLADGLVKAERRDLCLRALRSSTAPRLRDAVSRCGLTANGSPEDVVANLPTLGALQLLSSLDNEQLVALLDEAVAEGMIHIPPEEIRAAKQLPPRVSYRDTRTELSAWGCRSVRGNPTGNLATAIWTAYQEAELEEELSWRLRGRRGASPKAGLMRYLAEVEPLAAVAELVLSDQKISRAFEARLPGLRINGDREADGRAILWKLGFDLPRFDDQYERLRNRLTTLAEVVRSAAAPWTEDDREAIRGVGVNLFVSVEQFLEELIAYLVWMLTSDHFQETRGTFRYEEGLEAVPEHLGASIRCGDQTFRWSEAGTNTLGVLLVYLAELDRWTSNLLTRDREELRRPDKDLPHYADDEHREFLFWHVQLWADADENELQALSEHVSEVKTLVGQAALADVRNGVDHKRPPAEFPSREALNELVTKFRDALDICDLHRLLPKKLWVKRTQQDRFGRSTHELFDYMGRTIRVEGPSMATTRDLLGFSYPVILAPGSLLGSPNAHLLFRRSEESPIEAYWRGYPRRRFIPPEESHCHPDVASEQRASAEEER
jgi:hypothetical protein